MTIVLTRALGRLWLLSSALTVPATVICIALVLPAAAEAEFGRADLLSGTSELQFEKASAPAFAREGEYVAFEGSLAEVPGVWRRDLRTGEVEPVAVSESSDVALADAAAPSISANGRYVAFTTTADLDPEHMNKAGEQVGEPPADAGCPEVYVRDMSKAPGEEGAYTLASAFGHGEGITFGGPCASGGSSFAVAGAQAAPGVALSANGHDVVFTVLSASNLGTGPGGAVSTPPSQVAVRDMQTETTTIVTVEPDGEPVVGGGAFPSQSSEKNGVAVASSRIGDQITASTAAISGSGSTVAWLGTNVPEQVEGSGTQIEPRKSGEGALEVEPLWRRIAGGEENVTRRLLADAGLEFLYTRVEYHEVVRNGSWVATEGLPVFVAPALSEDGTTVALVSNAPRPAAIPSLEVSQEFPPQSDAYAVHINDDPEIAPEVIPLTETPDYDMVRTGAEGFVKDVAISPDGSRIAFDSEREDFTLPDLNLVSPPATGRVFQIYEANLELKTLQRVTNTYDGSEPKGGGAELLSFSGVNGALAFGSRATNLFYGDAMSSAEVYTADELPFEQARGQEYIGSTPLEALPQPEWKLDATAESRRDGSVIVHVVTPGAGRLSVDALAQVPTVSRRTDSKRSGGGRGHSRSVAGVLLATRTIATAAMTADGASRLSANVKAGAAYGARVRGPHGLYAVLDLTFSAPGEATLKAKIPVTFHRVVKSGSGRSRSRSAARATKRPRHGRKRSHRQPRSRA